MVSLNAWALYLSCLRLTYNLTIISPRLDTGFLLGITRLGVSPNYLICTEPAHHKLILPIFYLLSLKTQNNVAVKRFCHFLIKGKCHL